MQRVYFLTDKEVDFIQRTYYENNGINIVSLPIHDVECYLEEQSIKINNTGLSLKPGIALYKQLSLIKNLKKEKIDFVEFYYPKDYSLNKKQVKKTIKKVELFAKNIGLKEIKPIKYYLQNTYTDLLYSFGITTDLGDYCIADNIANEGRAYYKARLITYTKGGENTIHEFIHINSLLQLI